MQTLYHGGDIITMEGNQPTYVEAVIEREGEIIYTGSRAGAANNFAGKILEVDLKGKTLMPGFIEPHAHPVSIGAFILANDIVAPHEWRMPHQTYPGVSGKENYLKAVKDIIDAKQDKNQTVLIWGYHKSWHGELRLKELDKVTGDIPTIIWQRSTHGELSFLGASLPDDQGNQARPVLRRQGDAAPGYGSHFGHDVAEWSHFTEPGFPTSTFEDEYTVLKEGTEKAHAYTIYLIAGFPEQFVKKTGNDAYAAHIDALAKKYDTDYIKFLPKRYKTFADGAIYSLALQLREPFHNCPGCKSEWIIPLKEGEQIFAYWWDKGYRIHIHITGDLAFEEYLNILERAMKRNPRNAHRTTFHHVGLFDAGQVQRAADLGVEISANPCYLWALADKYGETGLDRERADNMVALKEFTSRGVPVSLHSDFSMAPAEPLLLAWVAANRIVASGKAMNPGHSISVYDAMKGITITAVRTFDMEHEIGSIKIGKQATFTILEQNPFKIDPVKIRDIPITGIVYKGKMKPNQGKRMGGGRDGQGCIGSAGYSWCDKTGKCEHPWELATKLGFENTREAFDRFCKGSVNQLSEEETR